MIYLSQMLGKPVVDATGTAIGTINDIAIATGEVFPRVTSLAFKGPDRTPFMLSWRKFVEEFDGERITLNVPANEIRFSYLQPDEVLLHRDLLNKQIVDTQGMKVVRVNDLKLSESRNQLRLLGAEVGARGLLRGISPVLENAVSAVVKAFGGELRENLIAWNYMDLLDRDLSQVKLSITHKRLHELHPADVADIIEKLNPTQRAKVFEHLDNEQAADTISELEDELQADVIDDLSERRASALLAEMDPDDAADIIGDLPYDKAEKLLRLMGVEESSAIRGLLGYKEKTAGGIMTPEVTTVAEEMTVAEVLAQLRAEAGEHESIYYIYVVTAGRHLTGAVSLRDLLLAEPTTLVSDIVTRELFTAHVDDDQETVAEYMSKYNLLAMPVIDETGKLLGAVTVDDALDVLEEEADEDLAIATGSSGARGLSMGMAGWFLRRSWWIAIWAVAAVAVIRLSPHLSGLGGGVQLMLPALALLPIVLRIAEDAAQRAIATMIEESEASERMSLGRHLLNDGAFGLLLGIIAGSVVFAVADLALGEPLGATVLGAIMGISIWLVLLASVGVTHYSRRRMEADMRVSGTTMSIAMMVLAAVVFLALTLAGGIVLATAGA
ncbi:MAG: CBS domain-containing protein [Coriobacteriia bacterium]|nr:CBS domain-containing protein [Coriobacteriia bacterium]